MDEHHQSTEEDPAAGFPRCGPQVAGLEVRSEIPNTGSISAHFHEGEYRVLPGLREVPMAGLDSGPRDLFYAADDLHRTEQLAGQIDRSGWIRPLIVVVDSEGLWVLEGGHRLAALHLLGKTHFPALVVEHLTPNYEEARAPEQDAGNSTEDPEPALASRAREAQERMSARQDRIRSQIGANGGKVHTRSGDAFLVSRNPDREEREAFPWRVTRFTREHGKLSPTGHTVHRVLDAPGDTSIDPIGAVQEVARQCAGQEILPAPSPDRPRP